MNKTKIYDAIIIGAGPAGLMAAREFDNNNINYLILEAKAKVGYPLRCGEITREETFSELFTRENYPFIKNKISRILFRIDDIQKTVNKNMFMIDKPEFLQWLSEPIKDNLKLETKLLEIKKQRNFLEIQTNKGTLHAKLVILANGTSYRFQKDFNLVKKNIELVPCIGGIFKNSTLNRDTAYFCYDEEMYIASWIFPKENNNFNAGAGAVIKDRKTDRLDLQKAFKLFMQKMGIPLEGELSFGGNYATNGPIHRTYSDRLLVCGDSAGQTFAAIGEGIYFSLKAGQLAGQTAIKAVKHDTFNSDLLKEYEMNWKKSFGSQMDAGVIFATYLFFLMRNHLTRYALKAVKTKEILDTWFNGSVSVKFSILYYFLKLFYSSPRR
ncbi:MAG: NAD(P)/FAD-dependent oxidoreductase [Desulfobacteraceae bacterium]|jgi:digeranylgeranylglycerophospholipid reductase